MSKLFAIAWNDYRQTVLTKTFLVSILIMPLAMCLVVVFGIFAESFQDLDDQRIVVIDKTGRLVETIREEATSRNRSDHVFSGPVGNKTQVAPRYVVESFSGDTGDLSAVELSLSRQVRAGDLTAFAIIGADVIQPEQGRDDEIAYYSNSPSNYDLPDWFKDVVNDEIAAIRFREAGVDQRLINKLRQPVGLEIFGLAEMDETGEIKPAEEENLIEVIVVPTAALILIFFTVNMSAPVMLNTVMEEKMNKIAEVLVASVSPTLLMFGKLLAATMVALTFASVYLCSLLVMLVVFHDFFAVPWTLYVWFFVFLLLALVTFGSIWAGIGAACSELKDTQNFSGVAVLMILPPMIFFPTVMASPTSAFSIVVSLIPPFTPMLMLLRMAIEPGPETWEVILSLVLTTAFAVFCVWAGGKIFRIGFLSQGQTPGFGQLLRWVLRVEVVNGRARPPGAPPEPNDGERTSLGLRRPAPAPPPIRTFWETIDSPTPISLLRTVLHM